MVFGLLSKNIIMVSQFSRLAFIAVLCGIAAADASDVGTADPTSLPCCLTPDTPEQVHISFASHQVAQPITSMMATWITMRYAPGAVAYYKRAGVAEPWTASAAAVNTTYSNGGWIGVIYTAIMADLRHDTRYDYRVGTHGVADGLSKTFSFKTLPIHAGTPGRPLRVASYADLGVQHSNYTIALVEKMVVAGEIDFVLHYGDIAYSFYDHHKADEFGRNIEPIAAAVPYMTVPGNHERLWNFTVYRKRWQQWRTTPGQPADAMYYDFHAGPIAFIMVDTEKYQLAHDGAAEITPLEARWVDARLKAANDEKKFTVVAQHRPLYGGYGTYKLRNDSVLQKQIEQVYVNRKTDFVTCGHVHDYTRFYPLKFGEVTGTNYTFPTSPVYVVNGAAGCCGGPATNTAALPYGQAANGPQKSETAVMTLHFHEEDGNVKMHAKFILSKSGNQHDKFELTKKLL
jgi:hypothetical protein